MVFPSAVSPHGSFYRSVFRTYLFFRSGMTKQRPIPDGAAVFEGEMFFSLIFSDGLSLVFLEKIDILSLR